MLVLHTFGEQWGHNLDELHARYISAVNPGKGAEVVDQIPSGPGWSSMAQT